MLEPRFGVLGGVQCHSRGGPSAASNDAQVSSELATWARRTPVRGATLIPDPTRHGTFILITITIAAFSLFTQVNIMTQGGPLDSTSTVVFMAVRTGFQQQQTGYASAISLVFFVIVLAVSLIQRYLTRDKEAGR